MITFDRSLLAFMALALAGFAVMVAVYYQFTAEDAWIVARYARNVVEHGQLVFNRGEFVNALTSPLDALLRIAMHAIAADPITTHKACAIMFSIATLGIGVLVLTPDRLAQTLFLVLTGLSGPFALWTVGGLETPLLALLLTAFVACLWRAPARHLYSAALLAGLAFLARHDSVLFTGPALLWTMRRRPLPRWISVGILAAVAPIAWLAFALFYFHDLFPTSFHIKGPGNVSLTVGYNALYLIDFFLQSGLALVFIAAFALTQGRLIASPMGPARGERAGLWIGLAVAVVAYGLLVATAHMMFSFRLFIPYLPVLALLAAEQFANATAGAPTGRPRRAAGALLIVLFVSQAALAYAIQFWTLNPARVGEYQYVGAGDYRRNFIETLPEAAAAIDADWRNRTPPPARPPRVLTFAAGLLSWRLPDAYIFEDLVSWRRTCFPDRRRLAPLADYVHLATPWAGTPAEQLPGPSDRWEPIWQRTTLFDSQDTTWMVFRNRAPDDAALPAYIDRPCRLPGTLSGQFYGDRVAYGWLEY